MKAPESAPIEPLKSFPGTDCNTCSLGCKKGPQDGEEQRQSAIDFEDEIQDFIYPKTLDLNDADCRYKRDTQPKSARDPETESIMNNEGEYSYFYKEITDPTRTSLELSKLRPFSTYVSCIF